MEIIVLIQKAQQEDEIALGELYEYISPKIQNYLQKWLNCYDFEVVGEGITEVLLNIKKFQIQSEDNIIVTKQFISWCFRIAEKKRISRIKFQEKVKEEELRSNVYQIAEQVSLQERLLEEDILAIIKAKLIDVLSPIEKEVIGLRLEGKTNQEIAKMSKKNLYLIENIVSRGRKKIEVKIFRPLEIMRIGNLYPDKPQRTLSDAIVSNRVIAFLFLNRWYAPKAWKENNIWGQYIDENLLLNNYVLVRDLPIEEYLVLRSNTNYQKYLQTKGNMVYIEIPILEELREVWGLTRKQQMKPIPGKEYYYIPEIARILNGTGKELEALYNGAKRKKLNTIKLDGRIMCTIKDAKAYLENLKENRRTKREIPLLKKTNQ